MSTCVFGHGDCPLLEEKNLRIAGLVGTVTELGVELEAARARNLIDEETIRKLRAEISRLRHLGPRPLGNR